ncbi:hypothetical protein ACJEKX_23790, partial [Escherichia coli]
ILPNKHLFVAHVHLSAGATLEAVVRQEQISMLRQRLLQFIQHSCVPNEASVLIGGDFNFYPSTSTYSYFQAKSHGFPVTSAYSHYPGHKEAP